MEQDFRHSPTGRGQRATSNPQVREKRPSGRRTLPSAFTAIPKVAGNRTIGGVAPNMLRAPVPGASKGVPKPRHSMPRPALSLAGRDKERMVELADDDMEELLRAPVRETWRLATSVVILEAA